MAAAAAAAAGARIVDCRRAIDSRADQGAQINFWRPLSHFLIEEENIVLDVQRLVQCN